MGALAIYDYLLTLDDEVRQPYPTLSCAVLSWRKVKYVWKGKKNWSGYIQPGISPLFINPIASLPASVLFLAV
jgi:hypothetical protein